MKGKTESDSVEHIEMQVVFLYRFRFAIQTCVNRRPACKLGVQNGCPRSLACSFVCLHFFTTKSHSRTQLDRKDEWKYVSSLVDDSHPECQEIPINVYTLGIVKSTTHWLKRPQRHLTRSHDLSKFAFLLHTWRGPKYSFCFFFLYILRNHWNCSNSDMLF